MAITFDGHGYRICGLITREQKKRRRVKGRARGFYEGIYVYVRVRLPDGKRRDIYLGTPGEARAPGRPKGGERHRELRSSDVGRAEWRNEGENASGSYARRVSEWRGGKRTS